MLSRNKKLGITLVAVVAILTGALIPTAIAKKQVALSSDLKNQLIYLVQEEKLAHDLYIAIYAKTGIQKFANISRSESRHIEAVSNVLVLYGIANPIDVLPVGKFADSRLQETYDELLSSVTDSRSALQIGVTVERLDLDSIADILKSKMPTTARKVLQNLQTASFSHLAAFSR